MTIEELCKAVVEGKKIRRENWPPDYYLQYRGEKWVSTMESPLVVEIGELLILPERYEVYKEPLLTLDDAYRPVDPDATVCIVARGDGSCYLHIYKRANFDDRLWGLGGPSVAEKESKEETIDAAVRAWNELWKKMQKKDGK